jgi:hypothetical protein
MIDAMRRILPLLLLATSTLAAGPVVPREPFAKAHVQLMARAQSKNREAKLMDIDVWAEGTRLRARVRGDQKAGEFWVDGLAAQALHLVSGKIEEPKRKTMDVALMQALAATPSLANANSDRIAGHPCKIISEEVAGGTMTRCIWHGVPLSVEFTQDGFSFNAAAVLVEEGAVSLADLQPPPGAPAAPASMSAGR